MQNNCNEVTISKGRWRSLYYILTNRNQIAPTQDAKIKPITCAVNKPLSVLASLVGLWFRLGFRLGISLGLNKHIYLCYWLIVKEIFWGSPDVSRNLFTLLFSITKPFDSLSLTLLTALRFHFAHLRKLKGIDRLRFHFIPFQTGLPWEQKHKYNASNYTSKIWQPTTLSNSNHLNRLKTQFTSIS